jgi:prepilin-type N-terminal cleavage/methylation domain-containing protein
MQQIKRNQRQGFTLVEIMIVVAIIGLLAAIAIPNFVRARTTSQKNGCINNLRQIDGAKQQWALEFQRKSGDPCVSSDCSPYLKAWPTCPAGGDYTLTTVATQPEVSCPNSGLGHTY